CLHSIACQTVFRQSVNRILAVETLRVLRCTKCPHSTEFYRIREKDHRWYHARRRWTNWEANFTD
ncbi:hypothetical protein M513_04879, partial [Trichuris suis]